MKPGKSEKRLREKKRDESEGGMTKRDIGEEETERKVQEGDRDRETRDRRGEMRKKWI